MATVRELAKQAGVSPATVSRALKSHPDVSDFTRNKVLEAAKEIGHAYDTPANSHAPSEPSLASVGYLIPGDPRLWEYDWMLLSGIAEGLSESRLGLQIVNLTTWQARGRNLQAVLPTQWIERRHFKVVCSKPLHLQRNPCRRLPQHRRGRSLRRYGQFKFCLLRLDTRIRTSRTPPSRPRPQENRDCLAPPRRPRPSRSS